MKIYLVGLTDTLNFTSVVNQCLVEPLKLVFNFGTNKYVLNDFFDLDIKVNISNDPVEKNKAVGWKCGYKQTKYLNWESGDNIHGGPEVVYVDVDTYKFYNADKIRKRKEKEKTLDIDIHVCWFNESQVRSNDVIVNIVWKGYLYAIPINSLTYNTGCCDNLVLTIKINLDTNTITYYPVYYVGVVTTYGTVKNNDFNASLGYVRLTKDNYDKFTKNHAIDGKIKVEGTTENKDYYFYTNVADTTLDIVKAELYRSWYLDFNDTEYNGKLLTNKDIDLIWQDKIKLTIDNVTKFYDVYNFKQIIVFNDLIR